MLGTGQLRSKAAAPQGVTRWLAQAACRTIMWLLRLLAVIVVVAIGAGVIVYAFHRQSAISPSVGACSSWGHRLRLLIFALMFIERLAIIPFCDALQQGAPAPWRSPGPWRVFSEVACEAPESPRRALGLKSIVW